MVKPVDRLDENEKRLQQEIKRIAGRFNEVNKIFDEVKKTIIYDRRAFEVLSTNFFIRRINEPIFRERIQGKTKEASSALNRLKEASVILEEEIERIKRIFQAIYKLKRTGPETEKLEKEAIAFASYLSRVEEQIKESYVWIDRQIENLEALEKYFFVEGDNHKRIQYKNSIFNMISDGLELMQDQWRLFAKTTLTDNAIQFRQYRRSRRENQ